MGLLRANEVVLRQHNGKLASFEMLCRRAQLSEWRHKDRVAGGPTGLDDDAAYEEFVYTGIGETGGLVMVAPCVARTYQ